MKLSSSTNGIIEFQGSHFGNQMRGDLIAAKYRSALFRIILSTDGRSVIPSSNPAIKLAGDENLDITQAPDGTIISARYTSNDIYYYEPKEPSSSVLAIKSIFPRRGGLAGGSKLSIYGANFGNGGATVTIGGNNCGNVVVHTGQKITCTLPLGVLGLADVSVTVGSKMATMAKAYKYISGVPSKSQC